MSDVGCILILGAVLLGMPVLYIWTRLSSEKAAAVAREATGERIHRLIAAVRSERSVSALRELDTLLQGPRVGFVAPLETWFEGAAPVLAQLVRKPQYITTVEWYFECFTFTAGHLQGVVAWLSNLMQDATSPVTPATMQRLLPRVMREAGPAEAEWLYARALERLRTRPSDLEFRSLVLQIGRLSYGAKRLDRRLTVYDEQAIANDIAMCVN